MARQIQRFNVDVTLDNEMASLASASGTSRSQQMNLALEQAFADLPGMMLNVMKAKNEWNRRRLTSFMVDPVWTDKLAEMSQRTDLSRDAIVKLAVKSYVLSKIKPESAENLQNTTENEAENAV